MAEICCRDTSRRVARRRRMLLQKVQTRKSVVSAEDEEEDLKRRRFDNGVSYCGLRPESVSASDVGQPRFGMASVCGRRRDMEDAVAIHPCFFASQVLLHYFGVYDGHGCSHVAMRCKERFHELVKEELGVSEEKAKENYGNEKWWKQVMDRSFKRMDTEVSALNVNVVDDDVTPNCRCELKSPECDAVGSTAVIAVVTPDEIVVANCGD